MPQLPARFSNYPATVRLDGSGNGTLRFQATGANIVITNLYVAVATTTLQAKCTIYKGQVAAANAIATTNSGSTGAQAGGKIELLDGEAVFVAWTGGDASTIATATFSGYQIPFEMGVSEGGTDFDFTDPFAASDGTIIFPALKSPNYVAGVSGWKIDRNGTVEFGSGTFRGDLNIVDPVTNAAVIAHTTPFNGIEFRPKSGSQSIISNGYILADANHVTPSSSLIISAPVISGANLPALLRLTQLPAAISIAELQAADFIISEGTVNVAVPTAQYVEDGTNAAGLTNTTATIGATTCGFTFVAPKSGRIKVSVSGSLQLNVAPQAFMGCIVRTGSTIGSGTIIYDSSAQDPGIQIAMTVLGTFLMGTTGQVSGLTADATYNIYVATRAAAGATYGYFGRAIGIENCI